MRLFLIGLILCASSISFACGGKCQDCEDKKEAKNSAPEKLEKKHEHPEEARMIFKDSTGKEIRVTGEMDPK